MRIKAIFLMFIAVVLFQSCTKHIEAPPRELSFVRETLLAVHPWQRPFYLYLGTPYYHYQFSNAPEARESVLKQIDTTVNARWIPTAGYFWALNSGELIFFNEHYGKIYVLNLATSRYLEYCPPFGAEGSRRYLWVGPQDDIYLGTYGIEDAPGRSVNNYLLVRYTRHPTDYEIDQTFNPAAFENVVSSFRVAPNGDIYVKDWGCKTDDGVPAISIFDRKGRYKKCTLAEGIISNGLRFNFGNSAPKESGVVSALLLDKDSLLAKRFTELGFHGFNFKATFDSLLIVYGHRHRTHTGDMPVDYDLPFVVVLDPSTGHSVEIDLDKCRIGDYKYFSVSDVSINYKGEIYALFVYFDAPGRITGDELIVLYRWTLAS